MKYFLGIFAILGLAAVAIVSFHPDYQDDQPISPSDSAALNYKNIYADILYSNPIAPGNYRVDYGLLDISMAMRTSHDIYYFPLFPTGVFDPLLLGQDVDPAQAFRKLGDDHGRYVFVVFSGAVSDNFAEKFENMSRSEFIQYLDDVSGNLYGSYYKLYSNSFVTTSAIRNFGLDPSREFYELRYGIWVADLD